MNGWMDTNGETDLDVLCFLKLEEENAMKGKMQGGFYFVDMYAS